MGKKILYICYGDSRSPKAWSNVPFLLGENLIKIGYELIRIDISPNAKMENLWRKYPEKLLSKFWKGHQYSYVKTPLHRLLTYQKIRKAVKEHPEIDFVLILSFDFYNKFSTAPTILLHDWSYDMMILDRLQRKPYFFEKWFINYQTLTFKNSEEVISLFQDAQKLISERHNVPVRHLGSNVVNDLNDNRLPENEILSIKQRSYELLLIGSMKYLEGARKLVRAARLLRRDYPDITLNIVNIAKERLLLEEGDININCYGYLDKGNPTERKQYYNLVTNARILVNPSETWAAYSSTVECMYNYTPIIIKPYEAFEMDYGKENNFGIYLENTEVNTVAAAIRKIFEMTEEDYRALCLNAHEKVKDQTWDVYAEKMAALMEGIK